jgi:hypothetical protein
MRGLIRVLLIGAVALGLGGCVAYPAGPYYGGYGYGYGYAPYYAPPVVGGVFIGGDRGFRRDWH